MTDTSQPNPANSLTPCPFGGNPKVAAQMGFPSCGIARPGPFLNDLNLGKSISGGRKSRRGGSRKSRRGGRKSRRGGTKKGMRRKTARKAYKGLHKRKSRRHSRK